MERDTEAERYGVEGPVLSPPPKTELVADDEAVSSRDRFKPDTDDVSLGLEPRSACDGWIVDETDEYKSAVRNGEVRPDDPDPNVGEVGDGIADISSVAGAIDCNDEARDRTGEAESEVGYD